MLQRTARTRASTTTTSMSFCFRLLIIRGFKFTIPSASPQAVCVKDDVEFDVYALAAGQSPTAVCAVHGLDAQN
jgi:hypothetical protein